MDKTPVLDERLQELRGVLGKIDPAGRKSWILELYDLRDGEEVLTNVVDIRSGQPYRRARLGRPSHTSTAEQAEVTLR